MWGLLGSMVLGTAAWAGPAQDVKQLLDQGKFAEAYQQGRGQSQALGEPEFDFFFAIACLETGNATEGVLALERYQMLFPDNRNARFHLARGYYLIGEDARAREEFDALLPKANSDEISVFNRYLDAIRARESRYLPTASAYLEGGIGFDSNANAGAASSTINLPGLPTATLGNSALRKPSWYSHLAVGAQGTLPLAPGLALFGGFNGDGKYHFHDDARPFDQQNGHAQAGLSWLDGRRLWRGYAQVGGTWIDKSVYQNNYGVAGDLQWQLGELDNVMLGLRRSWLDYENNNAPRNSQLTTVNFGWNRLLPGEWRPSLQLGGWVGEEANKQNRDDLGRDLYGARLALAVTPAAKWGFSGGVSYQRSRYQAAYDPTLGINLNRRDDYWAADAGVAYYLDRNLSIRGELNYSKQQSNIELYSYDRSLAAVKVRYEFK
jgi:hypothetical protein